MAGTEPLKLRDGEVVLYKRADSEFWQARFKLPDRKWHRISTKTVRVDDASAIACKAYDKARFLHDQGLPAVTRRFRDVAKLAIEEMEAASKAGKGKSIYRDYQQAINNYLIPFFGNHYLDRITQADIAKFEDWRKEQMRKEPAASTVLNHNAALHRVFELGIAKGYVTRLQLPTLTASVGCCRFDGHRPKLFELSRTLPD